ncbi:MAG: type II toxin-antitoxin system RelE/ParE family toxin [Burkholderiales bacterium]|nr:type II toxin-antitoxin system RelE/ParE family toxin [Burkholderiales bacterium]
MKLSLTQQAEQELVEGARFYAREADAQLAQDFIETFARSAQLLLDQPRLGAAWRGGIRRLPLRRFPYSIVYVLRADEVRVLALAHQSRKPGFWRGRS